MSGFERHRRSDRVIATFSGFEADLLRSLASQMVELLRNERAEPAGDAVRALAGALGVSATDSHRLLDSHPGDERILPGQADLAEDEEGPVLRDVDGDLRILDELAA